MTENEEKKFTLTFKNDVREQVYRIKHKLQNPRKKLISGADIVRWALNSYEKELGM